MGLTAWAESGRLPDCLIRIGIRRLLAQRLASERARAAEGFREKFIAELDASPIAVETEAANEQHYELPPEYFLQVLGPRLKYSACLFENPRSTLAEAEDAMLALSVERAQIKDGMSILELGCGWGSLSLYMAAMFPKARVVAVSNSNGQRAFIEKRAKDMHIRNLEVRTCDMNHFDPGETFDRVVSVEMFEHMKNYRELMKRIASWLNPGGKLFVHIFTHRQFAYPFTDAGRDSDWMARYFFTGGNMPSHDLLLHFQDDLQAEADWQVNGVHYSRTLEAWLQLQDQHRDVVMDIFRRTYGSERDAALWFQRWRMFYMACSELFRYRGGKEWMVSHYRFARR